MVAVAAPLPPPQQSPIFGHLASSHTVCSPRPRRSFLIPLYDAPVAIGCFRNDGRRGLHDKPDPCIRVDVLLGISKNYSVVIMRFLARHKIVKCETVIELCEPLSGG